jgi:aspartate aminotransferase
MRNAFARRRVTILELLDQVEGPNGQKFGVSQPEGAFYVFVDVSAFLNTPLGADGLVARSATEFAKLLLEQVNVAVVPMDSFGIANHIRFSYALADSKLAEGVRRIQLWVR